MTIAVGVGIGLSAMLFIRRSISLVEASRSEIDINLDLPKEISIYHIDGPLFFGSARQAIKNITNILPGIKIIILDMSKVTMLDITAIIAMEDIIRKLKKTDSGLVINNLQPRMILQLRRANIRKKSGSILFSRTINEALEKAKKMF